MIRRVNRPAHRAGHQKNSICRIGGDSQTPSHSSPCSARGILADLVKMQARCLLIFVVVLFVAGVLAASSYARIDPGTVVGTWLFDDGRGDVAEDSSGNQNNGTLKNNPEWEDGKFGDALEFNGSNYVDCGNAESLNIANSLTITAWMRLSAITDTATTIVFKGDGRGGAAGTSYWMDIRTSGQIYFGGYTAAGGACYEFIAGKIKEAKRWYHIAGTYDKTRSKIYVDGQVVKDVTKSCELLTNDINVSIGARGTGTRFNGLLDEVGLFNVALEQQDIQTIMNEGLKETIFPTAVGLSGKLTTTWAGVKSRH